MAKHGSCKEAWTPAETPKTSENRSDFTSSIRPIVSCLKFFSFTVITSVAAVGLGHKVLVVHLFHFLNSLLPWCLLMGSLLRDQLFDLCWIFCTIHLWIFTFCCRRSFSELFYGLCQRDSRKSARDWSALLLIRTRRRSFCFLVAEIFPQRHACRCGAHLQRLHRIFTCASTEKNRSTKVFLLPSESRNVQIVDMRCYDMIVLTTSTMKVMNGKTRPPFSLIGYCYYA